MPQTSIGNSTLYKLKAKYEGMNVSDLKRLKSLEDENNRLKQMYADISLEHKILKEVLGCYPRFLLSFLK